MFVSVGDCLYVCCALACAVSSGFRRLMSLNDADNIKRLHLEAGADSHC